MPHIPNENELHAADFGRYLGKFIETLHHGKKVDLQKLRHLVKDIETFLAKTTEEQNSPYFAFLLQQSSRYNSFTQTYIYGEELVEMHFYQAQALPQIVCHQGLIPPVSTYVTENNTPERFRPPHIQQKKSKTLYFYTPEDEEHFIRDYHKANADIFKATQKSNISGFAHSLGRSLKSAIFVGDSAPKRKQYFQTDLEQQHQSSRNDYISLLKKVENGEPLTPEEQKFIEGNNAFYQADFTPEVASSAPRVRHIGHASSLYSAGKFKVATDPVHSQTGSEGALVSTGGKILYPRKTAPAFAADRYPGLQVVWISHNHHDHLCYESMQKIPKSTLIIVPMGDRKRMLKWGFNNVIEMPDWNHSVTLTDSSEHSNETLIIHGLPARHASNRSASDYNESLYHGCLIQHIDNDGNSSLTLYTGDTAVWDEEHYAQLETFIHELGIPVSIANIATGPDRPRSSMACTHQSSADAIVFHARIVLANLMGNDAVSFDQLQSAACQSVAYHQGCFRLGLLSFNDANKTLSRLLSTLNCAQELTPDEITIDTLLQQLKDNYHRTNIHYTMMDEFERSGLQDLLVVLSRVDIHDGDHLRKLTVNEVIELIHTSFHIPRIGETIDENYQPMALDFHSTTSDLIDNNFMLAGFIDNITDSDTAQAALLEAFKSYDFVNRSKRQFKTLMDVFKNQNLLSLCEAVDNSDDLHEKRQHWQQLLCFLYNYVRGSKRNDESLNEDMYFDIMMVALDTHGDKIYQLSDATVLTP